MVININETLLVNIKIELVRNLKDAESRVADFFDFGETHGSKKIFDLLTEVRASLVMIGEQEAAELCADLVNSIEQSLNDDQQNYHDIAQSFLTLKQYITRLSTLNPVPFNRFVAPDEKSGDSSGDYIFMPTAEQQQKLFDLCRELKEKQSDKSSLWQVLHKVAQIAKAQLQTQENYELCWLIQQSALDHIKNKIDIPQQKGDEIYKLFIDYLNKLSHHGEQLAFYRQKNITHLVAYLEKQVEQDAMMLNDYSPPVSRFFSRSSSLNVVFDVSKETIDSIAFSIKKSLAETQDIFEEANTNGQLGNKSVIAALVDSLKLPKSAFQMLSFEKGNRLIDDIELLLDSTIKDDRFVEQFAQSVVLLEDALWQLDDLNSDVLVNPSEEDAIREKQQHTKNLAVNASKHIIAKIAHQFFKASREQLVENFSTTTKLNLMADAKIVHQMQSATQVLDEPVLAGHLQKTEQIQLFLCLRDRTLEVVENASAYLDVLVGYEIIFEQMQHSSSIDKRALQLLENSQNALASQIHFDIEQMATPDYISARVSNTEIDASVLKASSADIAATEAGAEADSVKTPTDTAIANAPESIDKQLGIGDGSQSGSVTYQDIIRHTVNNDSILSTPTEEIDTEILDIFLNEAGEILVQLRQNIKQLDGNFFNNTLSSEIRRHYHTLKGSARMVGLNVFGEFAWQHEELLNRVVEGQLELNSITQELLEQSIALIEKTIKNEPFYEDREALLLAAARAEAVKNALLGRDIQTSASDEPSHAAFNKRELSDEDIEALSKKIQQSPARQQIVDDNVNHQIAEHQEIHQLQEQQAIDADTAKHVNNLVQTSSLLSQLDSLNPADISALFSAIEKLKQAPLQDDEQALISELTDIGQLSGHRNNALLSRDELKSIAQVLASLGEQNDDFSPSLRALEKLKQNIKSRHKNHLKQQINALKSQLSSDNFGDDKDKTGAHYGEFINDLYDLEDDLGLGMSPDSSWEVLANLEKVFLSLQENRVPPGKDAEKINQALDMIANPDTFDEQQTKRINNDLISIRVGLQKREGNQHQPEKLLNESYLAETSQQNKVPDAEVGVQTAGEADLTLFADEADPHIVSLKHHLDKWKQSDFIAQEPLVKLSSDVKAITTISLKHQFASATELGRSVTQVLHRVSETKVRPHQEVSDWVEEALNEFRRATHAIGNRQEDQEIRQDILDDFNRFDDVDMLGEPLDSNVGNHDVFVADKPQQSIFSEHAAVIDSEAPMAKERIDDSTHVGFFDESNQVLKPFADEAEPNVKASKENFHEWVDSDFIEKAPPGKSSDKVSDITTISNKHGFKNASDLSQSVQEIPTRVDNESLKTCSTTTEQVENALDELDHPVEKIRHNNGNPAISHQIAIDSVSQTLQHDYSGTPLDSSIDTHDAFVVKKVDTTAVQAEKSKPSSETAAFYQHFIEEVTPHIKTAKVNFVEWKAADYAQDEALAKLRVAVKTITDIAEKYEVSSVHELSQAVDEIIKRIAQEVLRLNPETTERIEEALNALECWAEKIGNSEENPEISDKLIGQLSQIANAPSIGNALQAEPIADGYSSDQSLRSAVTAKSPNSANKKVITLYQQFVKEACPHIKASKDNFAAWKTTEYTENELLERLSDNIKDITDISEKHQLDEAVELGRSVGDILKRISKNQLQPNQEATQGIEQAIDEFLRSVDDIQQDSVAEPVFNAEIISRVNHIANAISLGTAMSTSTMAYEAFAMPLPQNTSDTTSNIGQDSLTRGFSELLPQQAIAQLYAFVEQAKEHIESSKHHFDKWQQSDFLEPEPLDKLSSEVKTITAISEKHHFESATVLGRYVILVLERVITEKVRPYQAVSDWLAEALKEFKRVAHAIGNHETDQEIKQNILNDFNQFDDIDTLGTALDASICSNDVFAADKLQLDGSSEQTSARPSADSSAETPESSAEISPVDNERQGSEQESVIELVEQNTDAQQENYSDPEFLDPTILNIFLEESQDIIAENQASLTEWRQNFNDLAALQNIQRGMHTIKGGSRMAELTIAGDTAHYMENLLDAVFDGHISDNQGAALLLNQGLDALSYMMSNVASKQRIFEPISYYEALQAFLKAQTGKSLGRSNDKLITSSAPAVANAQNNPQKITRTKDKPTSMLRVNSKLFETLSGLVNEDSIAKTRIERLLSDHYFHLEEFSQTISRVSEQLRQLESETEAQILFSNENSLSKAQDDDFDPLELDRFSEIQQLSRFLAESMHDLESIRGSLLGFVDETKQLINNQTNIQRELQDNILSASLVRFDSTYPRIKRLVHQLANELSKEVEVQIYGGHIEIERSMIEDLLPGFEHAIRNSLVHGIEPPKEREKAGKPTKGRIRIGARREGAEIWFVVADDGHGANLDSIRQKALSLDILEEEKAHDKSYLLGLLLQSNFSTQKDTTQLAGRGIGLNVLKEAVLSRQGNIELETEDGKGLAIFIRLPFTMSITEALAVKIGRYEYVIPMVSIKGIARIPREMYRSFLLGQKTYYSYGKNRYKLESLIDFIDPYADKNQGSDDVPALLVRIGNNRIAFDVDEIYNRQEIIIKPVNNTFTSIPGIVGAAILSDGTPVPVLEAYRLGRHFLQFQHSEKNIRDIISPMMKKEEQQTRVLIIDDSVTIRKISTNILQKQRFDTRTAKDGLDAIDVVSNWVPDIILLDIEMPRMDGFEFASHLKNDDLLQHIPIIMITSRTGEKHREQAEKFGVNNFLGKPYTEETLLASMSNLLNKDAPRKSHE